MFDITSAHRKKIYSWIQWVATALAATSSVLVPIAALVTDGPLAPILASVLAVVGVVGGWAGKLAKDHTVVDEILDAVDSVPGN